MYDGRPHMPVLGVHNRLSKCCRSFALLHSRHDPACPVLMPSIEHTNPTTLSSQASKEVGIGSPPPGREMTRCAGMQDIAYICSSYGDNRQSVPCALPVPMHDAAEVIAYLLV